MAVDVDHHLVLAARDARTVVEEADAQVFVLVVHLARGRVGDHVALVVERGVAPVGQHVAVRADDAGINVAFARLREFVAHQHEVYAEPFGPRCAAHHLVASVQGHQRDAARTDDGSLLHFGRELLRLLLGFVGPQAR